ncbi:15711_t:CDS:2, partial [Gigaspora margarita]
LDKKILIQLLVKDLAKKAEIIHYIDKLNSDSCQEFVNKKNQEGAFWLGY